MNFEFHIIKGKDVHDIIDKNFEASVQSIEKAYILHGKGQSVNPNSYFLRFPNKPKNRIIALPAYLGEDIQTSGIKWIASVPENIKRGFPRASAILILNDYETGYPFACLESSIISAYRTAMSAVIAIHYIKNKNKIISTLGIVGTGLIAKYVCNTFKKLNWSINNILLYDLDVNESSSFENFLKKENIAKKVTITNSLKEIIKNSATLVFTTTAPEPYISDLNWFSHHPVVLNLSLRDLSPEILYLSNNIVDDKKHVLNANTSPDLTYKKYGNDSFINGSIADLINGKLKLTDKKLTIFSPMGMGILDIALGKYVYDRAILERKTISIKDFFFELVR